MRVQTILHRSNYTNACIIIFFRENNMDGENKKQIAAETRLDKTGNTATESKVMSQ